MTFYEKVFLGAIFVASCMIVLLVKERLDTIEKSYTEAETNRSPAKKIGDIWYSRDPRTYVCFALTAPTNPVVTMTAVDCTIHVLNAVAEDRAYLESVH